MSGKPYLGQFVLYRVTSLEVRRLWREENSVYLYEWKVYLN